MVGQGLCALELLQCSKLLLLGVKSTFGFPIVNFLAYLRIWALLGNNVQCDPDARQDGQDDEDYDHGDDTTTYPT